MGSDSCLYEKNQRRTATKSLDIVSEVSIVRYGSIVRIKFNREFWDGVLEIPVPVCTANSSPSVYASRKCISFRKQRGKRLCTST